MRVVVTGGGTGGHIYPALAIARYLREQDQTTEILYIGTERGLESDIVPRSGFRFETVEVMGLKRKVSVEAVKTLCKFLKGTGQARRLLKEFQPDVVIGTGGFVCGPVVFTARTLGIPSYIHEMDAYPGLTNRFLSRFASVVGVCFAGAAPHFGARAKKVKLLGNPRASEVSRLSNRSIEECRTQYRLDPNLRTLVIVMGSRGASGVNAAVLEALPALAKRKDLQIVYVTGKVHYDQMKAAIDRLCLPDTRRLHVEPFVYEMPALLAQTDLIVTRAGGTTIAELTALGVPAIYIPSPYVTNNHQEYNAMEVVAEGGGILMQENTLTGAALLREITDLLSDEQRLVEMKKGALAVANPNALRDIYQEITRLAASDKPGNV